MNTSKYIPFKSVSPNIIVSHEHPDYPGIAGTGFFCIFPPFEYIFYVTAKHCFSIDSIEDLKSGLCIPISSDFLDPIKFFEIIEGSSENSTDDVLVFVVDNKLHSIEEILSLRDRSLRLQHQDDVELVLKALSKTKEKVRTFGIPLHEKSKTTIEYESMNVTVEIRGFWGTISHSSALANGYSILFTNWKEGEYRGFSGSPVISLHPVYKSNHVESFLLGMVLMAAGNTAHFLTISCITDLIASYINTKSFNAE